MDLRNVDGLFNGCHDKQSITDKTAEITATVTAMKLVANALKRSIKDVEGTSKQLIKAKERYEEQKARAGAPSAVLSGRPNLGPSSAKDSDPPVIRGYRRLSNDSPCTCSGSIAPADLMTLCTFLV